MRIKLPIITCAFVQVLLCFSALATDAVHVAVSHTNGLPYFTIPENNTNYAYRLEVSTNLVDWAHSGTFLAGLAPYPDLLASQRQVGFYRALRTPVHATNDWANQIRNQTFLGTPWGAVKFTILTNAPDLVYFQNRWAHSLHYDFASKRLPGMAALSPEAFDDLALDPSNQSVVLGGLVFPISAGEQTYGVEFVSLEPFEPSRLVELFQTVTSRVTLPGFTPFLLPSVYQQPSVFSNLSYFQSNDVPVRTLTEFFTNNAVQSVGWAVGTLKMVRAVEMDFAIQGGVITPDTILVTDFSPRDLPPLAGLISLTPSSPNSHTVLRLQAASLPYLDLPAPHHSTVTNLVGKKVLFATMVPPPSAWSISSEKEHFAFSLNQQFHITELGALSDEVRDELLNRKSNAAAIPPEIERLGRYFEDTQKLTPADARYVGSKAANYGVLRRTIPSTSPPAIAFSFDLWLDFISQTLPSGKTLREEIGNRLATISTSSSPAFISAQLDDIRDLIEDDSQFTSAQQAIVTNALSIFDPVRKIRFRSSSNAEDLPSFSAAGLYDSFSGCLLDDYNPGPDHICLCDPTDDKRRSVFRAIKKVFASFYNDQAFLERQKFGVEESNVGMALLVHHSFPDEEEFANGVATVDFSPGSNGSAIESFSIVSQRGAVSVANPSTLDLPEKYEGKSGGFGFMTKRFTAQSTMRPPGFVLAYPADYDALVSLFSQIGRAYAWDQVAGAKRLNFEFKKTPSGLAIKQVRPIYTGSGLQETILLPATATFVTLQCAFPGGVGSTLESSHELKSVWELEFNPLNLSNRTSASVLKSARVAYIAGGSVRTNILSFAPEQPGQAIGLGRYVFFGLPTGLIANRFISTGDNITFNLGFIFPTASDSLTPFILPSDLLLTLKRPDTTNGAVELVPILDHQPEFNPFNPYRPYYASFQFATNGFSVQSSYWLESHPSVPVVGMGPTYALKQWDQTVITGLTRDPIILKGYFSQTYKPGRHNSVEAFLFEPALEENLSPEIKQELQARNIHRIYLFRTHYMPPQLTLELIDYDGSRRPPSSQ